MASAPHLGLRTARKLLRKRPNSGDKAPCHARGPLLPADETRRCSRHRIAALAGDADQLTTR